MKVFHFPPLKLYILTKMSSSRDDLLSCLDYMFQGDGLGDGRSSLSDSGATHKLIGYKRVAIFMPRGGL